LKKFIVSTFIDFEERLIDLLDEMETQTDEFKQQFVSYFETHKAKKIEETTFELGISETDEFGLFTNIPVPYGGEINPDILRDVLDSYTTTQQDFFIEELTNGDLSYSFGVKDLESESFFRFYNLDVIDYDNIATPLEGLITYSRVLDTSFFKTIKGYFKINLDKFTLTEMLSFVKYNQLPTSVLEEIIQNIWDSLDLNKLKSDIMADIEKYEKEMSILVADFCKEKIDELNIESREGDELRTYVNDNTNEDE